MVSFPEVREADKREEADRVGEGGEEWAQEKGEDSELHCVFRGNQDAKLETIHEKF